MMEQITSRITLHSGDCLDILPTLAECSIDSCVTDPPYGLSFMGRNWDHGVPGIPFWKEVYRVLKPGAHLVAFGGSRTYHRMACAIEDAGFEIRDSLMWIYGVGFPKSHNISGHETFCQCGAEQATERNVRSMRRDDVSSPLNPNDERRQVLQSSVSECGPQGVRSEQIQRFAGIAQSSVEGRSDVPTSPRQLRSSEVCPVPAGFAADGAQRRLCDGASISHGTSDWSCVDTNRMRASSGSQAAAQRRNEPRTVAGQSLAQDGGVWENCRRCSKPMVSDGLGTALKPAFEPIVLARKPLSESTVAANVLRWRTGALNIDGCRIPTDERPSGSGRPKLSTNAFGDYRGNDGNVTPATGRWPANVCHDGSDEVVEAFPTTAPTKAAARGGSNPNPMDWGNSRSDGAKVSGHTDNGGSAARFFYSAKANKADRAGSKHPTVKPVSLMQWLCRLITPPGGTVLDPFAGSGTTGAAARLEGFRVVLIEREAEYQRDIRNRFATSGDLLEAAE